jgi:hypothetical protein
MGQALHLRTGAAGLSGILLLARGGGNVGFSEEPVVNGIGGSEQGEREESQFFSLSAEG